MPLLNVSIKCPCSTMRKGEGQRKLKQAEKFCLSAGVDDGCSSWRLAIGMHQVGPKLSVSGEPRPAS